MENANGGSALALLVLGILAASYADDDFSTTVAAAEDVAVLADDFSGWAYFHDRRGVYGAEGGLELAMGLPSASKR